MILIAIIPADKDFVQNFEFVIQAFTRKKIYYMPFVSLKIIIKMRRREMEADK